MANEVVTSQDDAPFSLACSTPLCLGEGSVDFSELALVSLACMEFIVMCTLPATYVYGI